MVSIVTYIFFFQSVGLSFEAVRFVLVALYSLFICIIYFDQVPFLQTNSKLDFYFF